MGDGQNGEEAGKCINSFQTTEWEISLNLGKFNRSYWNIYIPKNNSLITIVPMPLLSKISHKNHFSDWTGGQTEISYSITKKKNPRIRNSDNTILFRKTVTATLIPSKHSKR